MRPIIWATVTVFLTWTCAVCGATASAQEADGAADSRQAVEALRARLEMPDVDWSKLADEEFATVPLSRADAEAARELLWQHRLARRRGERAEEMANRELTDGELKMPFFYKTFGDAPAGKRSLIISMHGGGNAPERVNDRQWENQKGLYEPESAVYAAPRAPTNTWNLWHEPHIDRLFGRLIEDMVALEGVDPNRVYIMGYSAGGDGVYQLAPRMADRLAAAAMMAGHPNEASPLGLRNLPFAIFCGGRDAAYKRNEVAREWGAKLDELHASDPAGYVHETTIYPEKGHWMDREDAVALEWMAKFTRNAAPKKVVWMQDDVTRDQFYWLAVPAGAAKVGTEVVAEIDGQTVRVTKCDAESLIVRLNDELVDLDQPVRFELANGETREARLERTIGTLVRTLEERGDPAFAYATEWKLEP